jgi:hypothetical protein|mmetsp:Transcript_27648/g.46883  ORF Transcript_27648/g.46883 Transcript_27648/m.46883 type:complete len:92 (+) Transcript_27648:227-502(+)
MVFLTNAHFIVLMCAGYFHVTIGYETTILFTKVNFNVLFSCPTLDNISLEFSGLAATLCFTMSVERTWNWMQLFKLFCSSQLGCFPLKRNF